MAIFQVTYTRKDFNSKRVHTERKISTLLYALLLHYDEVVKLDGSGVGEDTKYLQRKRMIFIFQQRPY